MSLQFRYSFEPEALEVWRDGRRREREGWRCTLLVETERGKYVAECSAVAKSRHEALVATDAYALRMFAERTNDLGGEVEAYRSAWDERLPGQPHPG